MKKSGHRVLIFSQWTSMLDILEWTLDVIGVTYRRLDGSTQVTDRQTIVDTFNNDKSIFACLLSTRAGGQGLNLTGADTVIIHDMDFNPQIDRQAEDRCHRIGQTKPVTIFRLVTKSTVDENIYEIAKRKLVLDAAVLESGVHVDDNGDTPEKTMGEILASLLMG
jgi:SWI/SNF-related matrix-associated actin-dependent regulator 1 of chromatin subfamily A